MAQREEFLSFSIPGHAGSDHAQAMQQMHAWVNDRLARGGRVKHLRQTSTASDGYDSRYSLVTVVIEYPDLA
jgi:hypothetical protein